MVEGFLIATPYWDQSLIDVASAGEGLLIALPTGNSPLMMVPWLMRASWCCFLERLFVDCLGVGGLGDVTVPGVQEFIEDCLNR